MNDESRRRRHFWLGAACLAASLAVLFFQQPLGERFGVWVMALWLVPGALGVYFMGRIDDDGGPP